MNPALFTWQNDTATEKHRIKNTDHKYAMAKNVIVNFNHL